MSSDFTPPEVERTLNGLEKARVELRVAQEDIAKLREALEEITVGLEDHPCYQEEIANNPTGEAAMNEGGDTAAISTWAGVGRRALAATADNPERKP